MCIVHIRSIGPKELHDSRGSVNLVNCVHVCAQGGTPCTNCCSTRCSNQASSSTQCAALLPNPPALARGLTLRLKRCVPASQLVPPPPKRKRSRNLLGRPPSPHHEGGHKNCPPLFWRNQLGGHPMGEGKGGTPSFSTPPPEQPQTSLQVHLVHQQKPSQKMHLGGLYPGVTIL
ncbi:uncharacterized protein LOC135342483 [Halichondria panicea]|uniref:uncharacterized protein LOC135342483 n=1 Tax=Halichondria panicea TaxID=6063 RepID=UPI00312B95C1